MGRGIYGIGGRATNDGAQMGPESTNLSGVWKSEDANV